MKIEIKKLNSGAFIPTQATKSDAGYDLYSLENAWIKPLERGLFKTGISIAIPAGFYGRIAEKSGLAVKQGISVLGGVIDSGFRGEIGVILLNTNGGDESSSIQITKGQKIAQLIIEKCYEVEWQPVDELDKTERGENGYGSSGK